MQSAVVRSSIRDSWYPGNEAQRYPQNEAEEQDSLGPDSSDEDDECGNGAEEDTLHGSVVGYD
jgi:hypothetical protein